ncbi:disintegrin and metalloproteinase domain-containing protein 32 [Orycteropus afer afer]|uniref:Disintegrin and metalloproteinase domain-containing protein 32 n=1 Tax=Orycteropus afer afer TaxID=1230840 RepID=A0A8B6ZGT9_ORYAF|nr:disintegrin and metalloproteinase domain-containing protein 32 [Orycteropus afer afer]
MFRLMMLLAGPGGLLAARTGSQNSFLQIIFPEKIQANTSDNSELENEQLSYIIPIDEKPYIVHLKQRLFLAANFMVYLYDQGSVNSHSSNIQTHCYYQGYIEGFPSSHVTLSTCSGLRGILQFENVSYGIEPLELAVEFQHLLYKLRNENNEFTIFTENSRSIETKPVDYNIFISEKTESAVPDLYPLYLEIHIVVDKTLYDYLGSDNTMVTNKVIEIIGLVNSIFTQLQVTVVLSSLELWLDKNKFSTTGEADELLHRFLEWKQSYLTLRPHDIAYLFTYRDYPNYVGAVFPGKMCDSRYSAGIALYPKDITLEAFSVIVTQLLGFSLGLTYDDPKECHCSGARICVMNPEAMQSSGVKTFSNCSLNDFKNFILNVGARCLQNKPQMQRKAPICGNRKVEGNEVCDCGSMKECGPDSCCDPGTCRLKRGAQCHTGLCCKNCQIAQSGIECRPRVHPECDITEFCNGSSPACEPDVTIHNGHLCKNNQFVCYDGDCHDLDARCEKIFGKGSRNAPFACYEEIQPQRDRFGNCGYGNVYGYEPCPWSDLICGRLICTYPTRIPFHKEDVAVIYAFVRNALCITMDFRFHVSVPDPMVVRSGSQCDTGRICVNGVCVESRILINESKTCSQKCNGNGVCNSKKMCQCFEGFNPPDCLARARGTSLYQEELVSLIMERIFRRTEKNQWLIGVYISLPILIIATVIAVKWKSLKHWFTKEEESQSIE